MRTGTLATLLIVSGILMAASAKAADNDALQVEKTNTAITVKADGKQLMKYRYGDVAAKPYVQTLHTPQGINVLRDTPYDHVHHHGAMFAVNVDDVIFWTENKGYGHEKHRAFDIQDPTETKAGFTEQLDWGRERRKKVLLKEERAIEVAIEDEATLLAWKSTFTLPEGKDKAVLTGDHYHGLGLRFLQSIDKTIDFFMLDGEPTGENVRGTEYLTKAPWCAAHAEADGKPVTIAVYGARENARGDTLWFTMMEPFSFIAATLNWWKEPLELSQGESLTLNYTIAVWDGHVSKEKVAALGEALNK